jgi:hypothetical protein
VADRRLESVEDLRAVWPALLDHLRTTNALCASVLAEGRPVELRDNELTVAFAPGAQFLLRKADSAPYRDCVVQALRAVTGAAPGLAYELREPDAPVEGAEPESGAAPLSEDEWIARFVAEFDAEEILPDDTPEEQA